MMSDNIVSNFPVDLKWVEARVDVCLAKESKQLKSYLNSSA